MRRSLVGVRHISLQLKWRLAQGVSGKTIVLRGLKDVRQASNRVTRTHVFDVRFDPELRRDAVLPYNAPTHNLRSTLSRQFPETPASPPFPHVPVPGHIPPPTSLDHF
jgi:hypothetical protein